MFCPFLNKSDKRCIPARLSTRTIDDLVDICGLGWKDCPVYALLKEEEASQALASGRRTERPEIDYSLLESLLDDAEDPAKMASLEDLDRSFDPEDDMPTVPPPPARPQQNRGNDRPVSNITGPRDQRQNGRPPQQQQPGGQQNENRQGPAQPRSNERSAHQQSQQRPQNGRPPQQPQGNQQPRPQPAGPQNAGPQPQPPRPQLHRKPDVPDPRVSDPRLNNQQSSEDQASRKKRRPKRRRLPQSDAGQQPQQ
jgi:hypothetical protein